MIGLIRAGCVQHHNLARSFTSKAKHSSTVRRIQRFFQHQVLSSSMLAKALMKALGNPSKVNLVLDRTNWMFGRTPINLLVLSVGWGKSAAIPLFWCALPKKGNSNTQERKSLICKFIQTFGAERIHSLTADREFVGAEWFQFLLKEQIPFFIRLKENTLVDFSAKEKSHISRRHLPLDR